MEYIKNCKLISFTCYRDDRADYDCQYYLNSYGDGKFSIAKVTDSYGEFDVFNVEQAIEEIANQITYNLHRVAKEYTAKAIANDMDEKGIHR